MPSKMLKQQQEADHTSHPDLCPTSSKYSPYFFPPYYFCYVDKVITPSLQVLVPVIYSVQILNCHSILTEILSD